jgi:hypothetical protein
MRTTVPHARFLRIPYLTIRVIGTFGPSRAERLAQAMAKEAADSCVAGDETLAAGAAQLRLARRYWDGWTTYGLGLMIAVVAFRQCVGELDATWKVCVLLVAGTQLVVATAAVNLLARAQARGRRNPYGVDVNEFLPGPARIAWHSLLWAIIIAVLIWAGRGGGATGGL